MVSSVMKPAEDAARQQKSQQFSMMMMVDIRTHILQALLGQLAGMLGMNVLPAYQDGAKSTNFSSQTR